MMSDFKAIFCKSRLEDCTRPIQKFLIEIIWEAIASNPKSIDIAMLDLLDPKEESFSILPHKALYEGISYRKLVKACGKPKMRENQFKKLNDRELLDTMYRYRVDGLSNDKKLDLCRAMISNNFDFTAPMKTIMFANQIDSLTHSFKRTINSYTIEGKIDTNLISRCIKVRNDFLGHGDRNSYNKLPAEIKKILKDFKALVNLFNHAPNKEVINSSRDEAINAIEETLKCCSYNPLNDADLKKAFERYEYDECYILESRIHNDYDKEEHILYGHSIEDVESIVKDKYETKKASEELQKSKADNSAQSQEDKEIRNWLQMAPLSAKKLLWEDAANNDSVEPADNDSKNSDSFNPLIEEEKTHTNQVRIASAFPMMSGLKQGSRYLQDVHINELAENAVVMATADFWANDAGRAFLAKKMAPTLSSFDRRLVIDWNTRVELFKIETNPENRYSSNDVKKAKMAHNIMHLLAVKKFASYLPPSINLYSSDQSILNLAQSHPLSVFCVFTNSSKFIEQAIYEGVNNIIPISILPTGSLTIRLSAKPLVDACLSSEIKTPGYYKEDTIDAPDDNDISDTEKPKQTQVEVITKIRKEESGKAVDSKDFIASKAVPAGKVQAEADRIKVDDGKLIDIDAVPQKNSTVYDSAHNPVVLTKEIGEGGEGTIYLTDRDGKVAKIYKKNKLTIMRKNKLEAIVSGGLHVNKLCIPEDLLYTDKGEFVGYQMRNAEGYVELGSSVLKLKNDGVAKEILPGWDRLSLVKLCIGLCRTFQKMQERGLLMGDINPCNMMVNPKTANPEDFVFVDCDSYQFNGYPCPVGTMIFTSPKIYERNNIGADRIDFGTILRTIDDENYAIASLLFHILMLNESPFAGKGITNVEQAIRNYNFSFRLPDDDDNTGSETPDGDARLIWNNMPSNIRILFGRVFKMRQDVSVAAWIKALTYYKVEIERGVFTRELKPRNYWDKDGKYTKFFKCAACGETRNTPIQRFQKEEKYREPHLCAQCTQLKFSLKQKEVVSTCSKCGRDYNDNKWQAWLVQNGYRDSICPDCNTMVSVRCSCCGNEVRKRQWMINEERKRGGVYCSECRSDISVTCALCGSVFPAKKWRYEKMWRSGRDLWCPDCKSKVGRSF